MENKQNEKLQSLKLIYFPQKNRCHCSFTQSAWNMRNVQWTKNLIFFSNGKKDLN